MERHRPPSEKGEKILQGEGEGTQRNHFKKASTRAFHFENALMPYCRRKHIDDDHARDNEAKTDAGGHIEVLFEIDDAYQRNEYNA